MKLKQFFESEYGNDINLTGKNLTLLPSDLPDKVSSSFYCSANKLTSLKHCPSEVNGDFDCYDNELTSLEHCPSKVGGTFTCSFNDLTSLEHCPSEVGGNFWCSYDGLTSLEFWPSKVGDSFGCANNKLTSLKDIHRHIKKIGGDFLCHGNPIKSHILGLMFVEIDGNISTELGNGSDVDEILNRWKNQGRYGVISCQRDLIKAGYKDLAQL